MPLPTELKKPSDNLSDYSMLFAGTKKIGKTSLAIQFPKHYMMNGEPGNALHLAANYDDIFTWDQVLQITKDLESSPGYCKTLIIDDVPSIYGYCLEFTRKRFNLEVIAKDNFDIWRSIRKEFQEWLLRIRRLQAGLIFTAHIEVKEFQDQITNKPIHKMVPSFSGQLYDMMEHIGVLWGIMIANEKGQRGMVISPSNYIDAGNGFTHHFLWEGKQLAEIPLGNSPAEAYANFMLGFSNALKPDPQLSVLKPGGKVELLLPKKAGA